LQHSRIRARRALAKASAKNPRLQSANTPNSKYVGRFPALGQTLSAAPTQCRCCSLRPPVALQSATANIRTNPTSQITAADRPSTFHPRLRRPLIAHGGVRVGFKSVPRPPSPTLSLTIAITVTRIVLLPQLRFKEVLSNHPAQNVRHEYPQQERIR